MTVRYGALSDVGRVREGNEDSYLVEEPLFVVADGMGGHLAGDVASRMAVDVLMHDIDRNGDVDKDALVNAVKHANAVIFEESQSNAELSGMGTTCTLLFVNGSEGRIAHVGDSRAYLLRNGNLSQLTDDHTLVNRMVKEGRLRPEEAERHPQRSIITRALGVDANVKVDYKTFDLRPGDRILLCSDGLTSMLDGGAIHEVLADREDPEEASRRLVELANEAGGEDNITVVVVDVTDDGRGSSATSTATPAPRVATPRAKAVAREPIRIETRPSQPIRAAQPVRPPRRWVRRLVAWVVALAIVGVGGFLLVNFLLDKAWFVGTNEDGLVTIYQGIPEEVLGLDLKDELTTTSISVSDLPEFVREDVQNGIKVDSEEAARSKVQDLRERARDLEESNQERQPQGQKNDQEDGKR